MSSASSSDFPKIYELLQTVLKFLYQRRPAYKVWAFIRCDLVFDGEKIFSRLLVTIGFDFTVELTENFIKGTGG